MADLDLESIRAVLRAELKVIETKLDTAIRDQRGDHHILTGNGRPETGHVFRLRKIEDELDASRRSRRRLWTVLVTAIGGFAAALMESWRATWHK